MLRRDTAIVVRRSRGSRATGDLSSCRPSVCMFPPPSVAIVSTARVRRVSSAVECGPLECRQQSPERATSSVDTEHSDSRKQQPRYCSIDNDAIFSTSIFRNKRIT